MSDDGTSALALLDLDSSALDEITERLTDEAPHTAVLFEAMRSFTADAFGRPEGLPAETIEMRRSHLTLLVALIDDVRANLAEIFRAIDLDGRLPDADLLDPVHDGFNTAGEAMTSIVGTLLNPHQ